MSETMSQPGSQSQPLSEADIHSFTEKLLRWAAEDLTPSERVVLGALVERAVAGEGADVAGYSLSEFAAASAQFSLLQSAFSNALKAIGEGMAQAARKQ